MRPLHFLLLSALLIPFFCAEAYAGFTENLTVQVFDHFLRPVEGAKVYVEYQLNSVYGTTKTKPKETDATGHVNIIFTNYEQIESQVSYAYRVYVSYGNQLETANLIATGGKRAYSFNVESYVAFVRVRDRFGMPLQANVSIGGATKETDKDGNALFALPPGEYDLRVSRRDISRKIRFEIDKTTGDRNFDVILSYYPLSISVFDDSMRPLQAKVELNDKYAFTNEEGKAHIENITEQYPEIVVTHESKVKKLSANLESVQEIEVIFDLNKPAIKEHYSSLLPSGASMIRFFVEDFGPKASGIDTVSVSYETGGVQNELTVFAIGYNSFEARVPAQPEGTLVKYTIKASDKDGNIGIAQGNYLVLLRNQSEGEPFQKPESMESPPLPIEVGIVGAFAIAAIAYAAIYYYNKKKESSGEGKSSEQEPPNQS